MDIITPLQVLRQGLDMTTLKRLGVLVQAMLTMTGRITMLGLSRWAEKGGSYRTIQRFYHTTIPWGMTLWLFFKAHLYQSILWTLFAFSAYFGTRHFPKSLKINRLCIFDTNFVNS